MPTNKNAVTRFKYLDDMLSDKHHYYDIHDLTRGVNQRMLEAEENSEVSERCIQKDLHYLETGPFHVPLCREKRSGKILFIDDQSDNGWAKIMKDILKNNKGYQIIVTTASNKIWNVNAALNAGAFSYYIKESPEFNNPIEKTKKTI